METPVHPQMARYLPETEQNSCRTTRSGSIKPVNEILDPDAGVLKDPVLLLPGPGQHWLTMAYAAPRQVLL
jgi:hypothetical protein